MRRSSLLGLAAHLLAIASMSSACSGSRTNDAAAPDALDDAKPADAPDEAAPADAAPDTEAPDAPIDEPLCRTLCSLRTAAGCSAEDPECVSNCRNDLATGVCYGEARRTQMCVVAIGLDAFTCSGGRAVVKAEVCQEEKNALTACLLGPRDAGARD